jgi:small subunit ribosomal protein S20
MNFSIRTFHDIINLGLTEARNSDKGLHPYQTKDEGGRFLATHKSAIKRSKQNEKHCERNTAIKSRVKTSVKSVLAAIDTKDKEASKAALAKSVPLLAKAGTKGIFHKKTMSRKISRLTRKMNAITG